MAPLCRVDTQFAFAPDPEAFPSLLYYGRARTFLLLLRNAIKIGERTTPTRRGHASRHPSRSFTHAACRLQPPIGNVFRRFFFSFFFFFFRVIKEPARGELGVTVSAVLDLPLKAVTIAKKRNYGFFLLFFFHSPVTAGLSSAEVPFNV